jgi:hypothetical protein
MAFDWSELRDPAPGKLVAAREAAHCAAQALTKAARANIVPVADDSHSALLWEGALLVTQPLGKGARVGLDIATLSLVFFHREKRERGESLEWLDQRLRAAGLKPASTVALPYEVPERALTRQPGLRTLASWFAAGADALDDVRTKHARLQPSPAWVWPHHFDMATTLTLGPEKSIGVGLSMGDHHYAQPYAYISPYPAPKDPKLPALPPGAHWHTQDFFGAVATADELLASRDPRAALLGVIEAALAAYLR